MSRKFGVGGGSSNVARIDSLAGRTRSENRSSFIPNDVSRFPLGVAPVAGQPPRRMVYSRPFVLRVLLELTVTRDVETS